jgi:uncharacterized protein YaaN involved in tellurite resistance
MPPGPTDPSPTPLPEARVSPEVGDRVERLVDAFVNDVSTVSVRGAAYWRLVHDIESIGAREIAATARISDRLLRRPVRSMTGLLEGRSKLTKALATMRRAASELDPARFDLRANDGRPGGTIVGKGMRRYLDRYAREQPRINEVIDVLDACQAEIQLDDAAIRQEQDALAIEIETLRQYDYLAERLDDRVESFIASIEAADVERAGALRADVLFPVRQRRQDILTQLAVAMQGYAAVLIVRKNNEDLIQSVHRATTTTVAALQTAVLVAQSIADQQLVAEQVRRLDEASRTMLEEAAARRSRPAADVEALRRAWNDVSVALDSIDERRAAALAAMKLTVRDLSGQVERTQASLDRLDRETQHDPS